jgi:phosphoglycolate phosphatase
MNHKLILFDIDGTLLYHVGKRPWRDQYSYAAEKVFGVNVGFDMQKLNGRIERDAAWVMVSNTGISRAVFDQKFDAYVDAMQEFLHTESEHDPLYEVITSAQNLVEMLAANRPDIRLGIITGNARSIGQWKLRHTNLQKYFSFGLYGDEAEDRIQLAGLASARYEKKSGQKIQGHEIVIIGDTIYDVRCGKAIGAYTIAVTTGLHGDPASLEAERPDLLVDTLMDPAVLSLFSLR